MSSDVRMKKPWNIVGAGFNDDGVYFTFDDKVLNRGDVRLMEAAPELLEALQECVYRIDALISNGKGTNLDMEASKKGNAAISKALGGE